MAQTTLLSRVSLQATFRERTLQRLIDHLRTLIALDAVVFVTVDERLETAECSAGWFADELLRGALGAPTAGALDQRRRGLVQSALERDQPLLLPRVDAWESASDLLAATVEQLGPERARRVWRSYRGASVIACPLRAEIGTPLGLLVVASVNGGRPLGPADLRTVEVVADLGAMALERAQLLETEARRARDELRLTRASEAVSSSLELDEVYHRVLEHAAEITGATKVLLTRLNARAGELRGVAGVGFSPGLEPARLRLDASGFGQVVRERRALLAEPATGDGLDDGFMRGEGVGSLMHAPIELGPRLYGVLSVAHAEPRRFDETDLDLLARLGRSSAAAIANAIDFGRERRIARALTHGFVPESLPEVEGYETGLLYSPALGEPTGGDVYGAWRLPEGDVAVLVGDVAGKGVETAALSAMVRFFVEARGWDADSPALILEQANAMLMGRLPSDTFVTAFLGVLHAGGLRYCNAGHLPPLHVSRHGVAELEGHGLPLGVEASSSYGETDLPLEGGDLVFAYTDGLTEARRDGDTFGAERLARLVQGWALTQGPEEMVRTVHEEIAGWADGLSDDAVALALRRRR